MVFITLLAGFAMVSRFRYVHILNRYLRNRAPVETIAKIVIVVLLMFIHIQGALAAAFIFYALSAPTMAAWRRARRLLSGDKHTGPTSAEEMNGPNHEAI
jgi:phosphatidylserine synthase